MGSAISPFLSQDNTTVGLVNFYSPTSIHVLPTCPPLPCVDTVVGPLHPQPSQPAHDSSRLPFHSDFGVFAASHLLPNDLFINSQSRLFLGKQ